MQLLASLRKRPWSLLELLLAGLLIGWRCVAPTWHPVWMDILFYLGLYWILLVVAPEASSRSWVPLGVMLVLLAIYLQAQMPHVMHTFDILP